MIIGAGLLLLVGAVLYGPHIVDGGFTIDDWGHAAAAKYFRDGILGDYWLVTPNRPVLVVYVPLTYILFGTHAWVHLAWALILAVALSLSLFALLRRLGMQPLHAGAVALLLLIFPFSDATRFWATASHINLGITFAIAGILVALRGLEQRAAGRVGRERVIHAGAIALYALSVLTYEIAGIALFFVGALYLTRADWRVTRIRWAIDAVVVAACLAWTVVKADRERQTLQQMLEHLRQILDGGASVVAHSFMPFVGEAHRWLPLTILVAVTVLAAAVWALPSTSDGEKRALRFWLLTWGAGFWVVIAGWVLYIAADPYYQVNSPGVGNRTNALAAIGVILIVYSTIVLGVTLAIRAMRRRACWTAWAASILVAVVAVGYARDTRAHQREWAEAARASERMRENMSAALPDPPAGSTIYTFNYPGSSSPGVVIFAFSWDLNGAIKILYDDPTLAGYPILEGASIRCGRQGLYPVGMEWTQLQGAAYGKAFFIDVANSKAERIDSAEKCRRAVKRFKPGPPY